MSAPYARERLIAELAVQRAAILPQRVFQSLANQTLKKADKSPVTLADLGAQALIISAIHHNFPNDRIIGEEDSAFLRSDQDLQNRVWELVSKTHLDDDENERVLGALGSATEMLDVIDLGSTADAREGRVWVLDPIDGTLEFLEGGQYAVCLALLVDGEQQVGVLGCPNLDPNAENPFGDSTGKPPAEPSTGVLISAARGQGSVIRSLSGSPHPPPRLLSKVAPNTTALRMVDYLNTLSADLRKHRLIASHLSAAWPSPDTCALQLKWVALALGQSDIFVRIPRKKDKHDWIWDHAGGMLIAEEAGVKVTDISGTKIDFGSGRRFMGNSGWVAATEPLHGTVFKAVGEIMEES